MVKRNGCIYRNDLSMYKKIDVLTCSTGLCVICLLQTALINEVTSYESRFLLPALPETSYTLNDVIILPENKDFVETTVLSRQPASVLTLVNVTRENGFQLGSASRMKNASIESGLEIITQARVTVVIQLATGLLHLPSVEDFVSEYRLFTIEGSTEENYEKHLFIQSIHPNTSVSLCFHNFGGDEINSEFIPYSHGIPSTQKCISKNITASGTLLLNSSVQHEIEIISDYPFSILEGRGTHLSSSVRNGGDLNTSSTSVSPISWNVILPYKDWSNQFVLIPSEDRREVKLWLMSFENTSIDIVFDGNTSQLTLTANTPRSISVSVERAIILRITGNNSFTLRCEEFNVTDCSANVIPINLQELNISDNNRVDQERHEYQWIYISNASVVRVICPYFVDVSLYSSNWSVESAESAEEITLNISRHIFVIKYFRNSAEGLFKLLASGSLQLCDLSLTNGGQFYTHKVKSILTKNSNMKTSSTETRVSENTADLLKTSALSTSRDAVSNTPETTTTLNPILETKIDKASPEVIRLDTVRPTQKSSPPLNKEPNKKNSAAFNNKLNNRFKAVVDILHTKNGTVNTLVSQNKKSKNRNQPTYVYRLDVNDDVIQEGDGKSLVAVIVSLVSAILAVGAIILIFLLKEFFSRRQQIRKTKIRPFISYY